MYLFLSFVTYLLVVIVNVFVVNYIYIYIYMCIYIYAYEAGFIFLVPPQGHRYIHSPILKRNLIYTHQ